MNTKAQGDVGVAKCIAWAVEQGGVVLLPISDNQKYDLALDFGDGPKTVQVKTAIGQEFELRTKGGNKTGETVRGFDPTKVDYLFLHRIGGDCFFIPTTEFNGERRSITPDKKYVGWKL